jgi:hypothetical protein
MSNFEIPNSSDNQSQLKHTPELADDTKIESHGLSIINEIKKHVGQNSAKLFLEDLINSEKLIKTKALQAENSIFSQKEIKELERIAIMYLDYAENQAIRKIPMKMNDWIIKLDSFLKFNDYDLLDNDRNIL